MLIEIHMIQNHSPSNLNRDDLGAPKTCVFGGVTRARISSQCIKRSIRNPGNPDDFHNREPGMFAVAMGEHMGTKTRVFPWLVGEELKKTAIPVDEHSRIVLAAQRIGASKENEEKKASAGANADPRPKTAQLIHLGPQHAKLFVQKLVELKGTETACYKYFLNPKVGFEELVANELEDSGLEEKIQTKIVKSSWLIAKCRMADLLKVPEGETPEIEPALVNGQPGEEHAELVAAKLYEFASGDEKRFKELTKNPSTDEKQQVKDDAPDKPKGMEKFVAALKESHRRDAADIALFGRMTTSDAFENVEAAMQVAHAISTHAAVNDVDFGTAIDDKARVIGAGHLREDQFTAACFYKYFSLDWKQLVCNLTGPEPADKDEKAKWFGEVKPAMEKLAAAALGHFIRAAALTTPSGKQNSFAANNEPCGILVEIKDANVPTSYANAFAEPVERNGKWTGDAADESSLEGRSVACLADQVQSMLKAYGIDSTLYWYSPKLWRFPLQYWERAKNGKKQTEKDGHPLDAKPITKNTYDVLDELTAAVVNEVCKQGKVVGNDGENLTWADVRNAGKGSQP